MSIDVITSSVRVASCFLKIRRSQDSESGLMLAMRVSLTTTPLSSLCDLAQLYSKGSKNKSFKKIIARCVVNIVQMLRRQ